MKDNYYERQLKQLKGNVKVKFMSDLGNETNWLDLTKECCQAISKTTTELYNNKQINVL